MLEETGVEPPGQCAASDRIWSRGRTRLAWRCQSPGKPRASCFPEAHSESHPPSPIQLQCVIAEVEGVETQWHPWSDGNR